MASEGFPTGPIGYLDLEGDGDGTCNTAIREYISGFSYEMSVDGLRGGLYDTCSSDWIYWAGATHVPTGIDVADIVNSPDPGHSVITSACVPSGDWADGQRIRQGAQNTNRDYGGVTLGVDDDCAYTGLVDSTESITGEDC